MDRGGPALTGTMKSHIPERTSLNQPPEQHRVPRLRHLLLWAGVIAFLGGFFFYPLVRILALSLDTSIFSVANLRLFAATLWFSIAQAFFSMLLTMLLGIPAAWLFSRFHFRGKTFLRLLMAVPFMLPTVVVAAGFNAWLGPRGWLNMLLMGIFQLDAPPIEFIGSLNAILLAHVFYNTSIVVRMVGNALAHLDPRLNMAARSLGASPFKGFWRVTMPLLRPSILSAALLVFLFDFTSFGVILLLGGTQFATLEVEIYLQAVHFFNLPMAAWLSIIQLLFTLLFSILYSRLVIRGKLPLAPRAADVNLHTIRTQGQRVLIFIFSTCIFLFYSLPLASLPFRSIARLEADLGQRGEVDLGLTLNYYGELFINRSGSLFYIPPAAALANSLGYAALTVLLSLLIGFPAAIALAHPGRLERWLDPLLMLPLGASAVTLGLGFILAFGRMIASPWMVPLAHTLIALPFVIRTLQPALASIPPQLQDAARSLGASSLRVWVHVDWPIIRRAVLAAAVFAYTVSLGEFGATTLLARPEYPTLPVAIYRFLAQPGGMNYGQAMAMATILMVVCGAGILFLERLRLPGAGEF